MMPKSTLLPCHELLDTSLAAPWVYRRDGRYSLRVRPVGSKRSCTLSLKTTNRTMAMTQANRLLSTLRAFHLDQPDASWEDLRVRLKEIAEDILGTRSVWSQLDMGHGQVYADIREDLSEIAATEPLSHAGAKAVLMGARIMTAGEERLQGDLKGLIGIIEELDGAPSNDRHNLSKPVPICIDDFPQGPSEKTSRPPTTTASKATFRGLYEAFMAERGGDLAANTRKNYEACTKVIDGFLEGLDLSTHSREDLLKLRVALLVDRKPSTVNKIMTHLSMVIGWAVATGLLKHNYSRKLMISKGSGSTRQAFSPVKMSTLKTWALGLPDTDWRKLAMALGIATGARVGEIHQLTSEDIYKDGEQWLMSINDNGPKTLKNPFSRRIVPLVGIPEEILEAIKAKPGKVFKQSSSGFEQMLNQAIRDVLEVETGTGQSFHSLRNSMASDLKTSGVSLGIAQAIIGHSSKSLAFDLYGGNASASMGLMVEALRLVR